MFDFPRLQLTIIASTIIIAQLLWLDYAHLFSWLLLIITLLCNVYQLWWIVPYTPLYPVEVKTSKTEDTQRTFRILTANVLMSNRNAEVLLRLVGENNPDVIVTLESDKWWESKLGVLEPEYPYTVKCPLDNFYGMHVYSKLKLENPQIAFLVEPEIPSIHALLELPSGAQVRMHFLHPSPPSPTQNETSTERDVELIIVAKSVAETDVPVVITGDLNDVAWSSTTRLFRKTSGLLDPRIGRGMYNTYNAKYWFMRWPLDHLFHSDHFTLSEIKRIGGFGSDHFALLTELAYEGKNTTEQNGLSIEPGELASMQEKIKEQSVDKDDVPTPEKI